MTWKALDSLHYDIIDDTMVIRGTKNGSVYFLPPMAPHETAFIKAIEWIHSLASVSSSITIKGLSQAMTDLIHRYHPDWTVVSERDYDEYLYDSEKLRTLSGNLYAKKRNLYKQFIKQYTYRFETFESSHIPGIKTLLDKWVETKQETFEHRLVCEALKNLTKLNAFCDVLFVDDTLVAFSIGSKDQEVGLVLFEKADVDYIGVYQAVNLLFANKHFNDVPIINRQEDLGLPSLRKAKLSYNPIGFVYKHSLTFPQ